MKTRRRILISEYACNRGKGSEPGVAWNMAWEMAKRYNVWVLSGSHNLPAIQAERARTPLPGLRFASHDASGWARWWKKGRRGVQVYYNLLQLGAYRVVRRLQQEHGFDLAHHATCMRYRSPSGAALLSIPHTWGPFAGEEPAPSGFRADFSRRGQRYEWLRDRARCLAELDWCTAHISTLALATAQETLDRISVLPAKGRKLVPEGCVLNTPEIEKSQQAAFQRSTTLQFIGTARLFHWKGYHLGIRAFATVAPRDAAYWIVRSGADGTVIEVLAHSWSVAANARLLGYVQRPQALEALAGSVALLHLRLRASGGWVCLEAMGAGKPVMCLELGGPSVQVTPEMGFKAGVRKPAQAVSEVGRRLAGDKSLRQHVGGVGRRGALEVCRKWRAGKISMRCCDEAVREMA